MPEDLKAIEAALRQRVAARTNLYRAVSKARESGCTWASIAQVLGVSRQAATERFGKGPDMTGPAPTGTAESG